MNIIGKVTIGSIAALGLAIGPAVSAAATTDVLGSGALAGGVVIGAGGSGATSERSTRGDDGGGGSFWQWGVGKDDTYSNYFREKRCHGATAVGKKTKRVTNVAGGKYAKALTPKATSGNKAYYHNC